jgi:tetratricopeptide (TPR) repeat protein
VSGEGTARLVGRDAQVRLFEELLRGDGSRWVMLVDGLSGTGKRELLEWLRRNRDDGMPSARIELSPSVGRGDRLLQQIVAQLDPGLGANFAGELAEQASEERRQPLVNYAPTYHLQMQARWGGTIRESDQSATPALELGPEYLSMIQDERRSRRLDLLESTLAPLADRTWVLFVSEAEHLDNRTVRELLLDDIAPRLRAGFPGFRLYLTGETVPHAAFALHERIDSTLEPLGRDDAVRLLRDAGLTTADAERGYELTLGHRLLLQLYSEGVKARAGAPAFDDEAAQWPLDESARTQWIYDSVLAAIADDRVRAVAAELALFEWFDAGLLQAVFDVPLADRDFDELVRRSFVRPLPNGRWRCHDVIRKHLRPRLLGRDPARAIALQRAVFQVLSERLVQGAERAGSPAFAARLDLAVAAVHSAAEFSSREAEAFALSELALAFAEFDEDYVYAFARALHRSDAPPVLAALAQQAKEALELINGRKWSDAANDFMDRLAAHALRSGETPVGATLLRFAAIVSGHTGRHEAAVTFARRAAAAADSLDARLLLARSTAGAGRTDEAAGILSEARATFGDSVALRVAEADLAAARGETDEAARRYTDAIAAFPAAATDARLRLANLLVQRREHEAALAQVDALLAGEPAHHEAVSLRLDILANLGRVGELLDSVGQLAGHAHDAFDLLRALNAALADPRSRGRLLAMLQLDWDAVPWPIAFVLCDVLAGEGAVDRVMELTRKIEERHPRARPLCDIKRAAALLAVGRDDEAVALLQPLVSVGVTLPDAYFLLARCHQRKREGESVRAILRQVVTSWPAFRDAVDAQIAGSLAAEERIDDAVAYLAAQDRAAPLGPVSRLAQAQLIAPRDPDRALTLLEQVIHTYGRDEMVLVMMIATRFLYAMLLAERGRRDEAARVAQSLREQFGNDDPEAVVAAAKIYAKLGDEDSLRRMFAASDGAHPRARSVIVEGMIGLLLAREPSTDNLFRALESEPHRIELLGALLFLLGKTAARSDLQVAMERIERIAPVTLSAYLEMSSAALALASPGDMAPLAQFAATVPLLRIGVARTLGELGKISVEAARRELRAAVAARADLVDVAASAEAQMLIALERTTEAAAVLAPYLDRDDPPEAVLDAIAALYAARDQNEAATRFFRRVAERFPNQRRSALEALVDLLNTRKRYDEALEMLAAMEREAPLDDGLLLSRADALAGLERYDEALAAVRQAEALPDLPPARGGRIVRRRAILLRESGKLDEAIAAFHEAIGLAPRDGLVRLGLAKALRAAGRWGEAYEAMLDGVALAPSKMKTYEADLRELREQAAGEVRVAAADGALGGVPRHDAAVPSPGSDRVPAVSS